MPALLAYLIAVGLLLGGGYGALSWLAAPELVKVATKTKLKPPPRYDASSEASSIGNSSAAGAASLSDSDRATLVSNDPAPSSQPETNVAVSEQGARPLQASEPAMANRSGQDRSGNAGAWSTETSQGAKQEAAQQTPTASPVAQPKAQITGSNVPAAAAKPVKRAYLRQAGSRSEKPGLVLMTLRTIEFPDGRR